MSDFATVFVCDADSAARDSARDLVESMGLRGHTFATAGEFLEAINPSNWGCLVTEIALPDMSGVELLAAMQRHGIKLPAIVLSDKLDVPSAIQSLKAGAVDVIEKPSTKPYLKNVIAEAIQQHAELRKQTQRLADIQDRLAQLTPSQRRVLKLVIAGKPNKFIARKLEVSMRTIEKQRAQIYKKLAVSSVAELVTLIMEAGESPRGTGGQLDEPGK